MSHPSWDLNMSSQEFRQALLSAHDQKLLVLQARLLSRVPFREVFSYISFDNFVQNYLSIKPYMTSDLLGLGRIEFWDWLYEQRNKMSSFEYFLKS